MYIPEIILVFGKLVSCGDGDAMTGPSTGQFSWGSFKHTMPHRYLVTCHIIHSWLSFSLKWFQFFLLPKGSPYPFYLSQLIVLKTTILFLWPFSFSALLFLVAWYDCCHSFFTLVGRIKHWKFGQYSPNICCHWNSPNCLSDFLYLTHYLQLHKMRMVSCYKNTRAIYDGINCIAKSVGVP